MTIKLERAREYVRESLWVIPAVATVASIGLAFGLIAIDRDLDTTIGFAGSPESARSVLSTIAASMITFTGLVFTITIVALQLSSGQLSPRVMRTFLRDRRTSIALATFVSTFMFAVVALRSIADDFLPTLSIGFAIALVVASVGVFIMFIHHMAHAIRASSVISSVAKETRECIERQMPERDGIAEREKPDLPGPVSTFISPEQPGVLIGFDADALVRQAAEAGVVLELVPGVGDFVPTGADLVHIHGDGEVEEDALAQHVDIGDERTMQQDVAFGLRQLVDIASRALSPGVNDPTTAVQAIDQIHDLLRRIATRALGPGRRYDDDGHLRLDFPAAGWDDYVSLGIDEVRQFGGESMQVLRRLRAMVIDLLRVAPEDRREPLSEQLQLLDAAAERAFEDRRDVEMAVEHDQQGVGS